MNTYLIDFFGRISAEMGETAGKAKYNFFLRRGIKDVMTFKDFIKQVKTKKTRKCEAADMFPENADLFNKVCKARNISFAKIGMKVEVEGEPGIIVGANSSLNLNVYFQHQKKVGNCHPCWRIKYFDDNGNLIKEFSD